MCINGTYLQTMIYLSNLRMYVWLGGPLTHTDVFSIAKTEVLYSTGSV